MVQINLPQDECYQFEWVFSKRTFLSPMSSSEADVGFKWRVLLAVTALKVLLMPAYHSTDFEVHRNWLAITGSLPLDKWYTETTSEWTLDYPPLFAWFEWLLAQVARYVDPKMLQVDNLDYASDAAVTFQRGSVIVTDLVLVSAAWFLTRRMSRWHGNVVFFLIVANPGLLIVDHIHFQYNGLLLGVLLWSMALILEGYDLLGGVLFAVLVNMKHLFASLGPLYFVYLFRHYCRGPHAISRFLTLGGSVASVCALSLGPFIERGQLRLVLTRLFPFGRGLCHAYWAANAWALYAALDKAMTLTFKLLDIPVESSTANLTGGLVGTASFTVLPDVHPIVTLLMVLVAMLPALVLLWRNPQPTLFVKTVAYAALCSFMLGYHVHEKAILVVTVPAAINAITDCRAAGNYLFLSTVGTYQLLPLLFTPTEYPIKILLLVTYTGSAAWLLSQHVTDLPAVSEASTQAQQPSSRKGLTPKNQNADSASPPSATAEAAGVQPATGAKEAARVEEPSSNEAGDPGWMGMLTALEWLYLAGLMAVEVYGTWVHPHVLGDRLPFLPLMLTSVYCAAGMVYAWAQPESVEVLIPSTE